MTGHSKQANPQIQVINRAARILRTIRSSGSLGLSELARQVKLPLSTVHRIVSSLESEGLLSTNRSDGRICLGLDLLSLGAAVHLDIRRLIRPYLELLSQEIDETVDLSLLDEGCIVFLDQVTRSQRLQAVSGVGVEFPLHCTANGKALLAALPANDINRLLPEKLASFTPHTITSRALLLEELEQIRIDGCAFDREEHTLGICAVGALIQGPVDILASISIPVPSVRFYGSETRFRTALLHTCSLVNQAHLGY